MIGREAGRTGGGSDPAAGVVSTPASVSPASATPADSLGDGPEFDLVRGILARRTARQAGEGNTVRVGPGDDAAVVGADGIVLSVDLSVEGVHFRRDWLSAFEIGRRAAVASLSDLAAMAAECVGILVSVARPRDDDESFVIELMAGATQAVEAAGGVLLGGDLTASPGPLVVDVVAVGRAGDRAVLRGGARPGDEIWVTGRLGAAAAAVRALEGGGELDPGLRVAFAGPFPRIREARWLSERCEIGAMIDLSDGLAGDVGHIAKASGVAVVLDLARVPVNAAVASSHGADAALDLAVSGGEDYELCLAAAAGSIGPLREAFMQIFGVELTCVGAVAEGEGVHRRLADGGTGPMVHTSFQHFREGR